MASGDLVEVPHSGRQLRLTYGDQVVNLASLGGGIRTYRVGDWDLVDGYAQDEMAPAAHGQTLLPWPNRIRDGAYPFDGSAHQLPLNEPAVLNAIHGLTRWEPWEAAQEGPDRARMRWHIYPQPGYPFSLDVQHEYRLGVDGLAVTTSATNAGNTLAPYGCGFHPYLSAGTESIDTAILRAPGQSWMPADERMIPTMCKPVTRTVLDFRTPRTIGDTVIDNAFTDLERDSDGRAHVELAEPSGRRRVRLWMDPAYGYLMLFTADTLPEPRRRRALGVEPMTCAPNAFQTGEGLVSLEPGQSHTATWGRLRLDHPALPGLRGGRPGDLRGPEAASQGPPR